MSNLVSGHKFDVLLLTWIPLTRYSTCPSMDVVEYLGSPLLWILLGFFLCFRVSRRESGWWLILRIILVAHIESLLSTFIKFRADSCSAFIDLTGSSLTDIFDFLWIRDNFFGGDKLIWVFFESFLFFGFFGCYPCIWFLFGWFFGALTKAFSDIVDSEFFRSLGNNFTDFWLLALLTNGFFLNFAMVGPFGTLLLEVQDSLAGHTFAAGHLFSIFFLDGPI